MGLFFPLTPSKQQLLTQWQRKLHKISAAYHYLTLSLEFVFVSAIRCVVFMSKRIKTIQFTSNPRIYVGEVMLTFSRFNRIFFFFLSTEQRTIMNDDIDFSCYRFSFTVESIEIPITQTENVQRKQLTFYFISFYFRTLYSEILENSWQQYTISRPRCNNKSFDWIYVYRLMSYRTIILFVMGLIVICFLIWVQITWVSWCFSNVSAYNTWNEHQMQSFQGIW